MAFEHSYLPASFLNEVVSEIGNETIVRSNLYSVADVYSWIREFERKSNTKWNLRNSKPSGTRILCSYKFICHHSGYHKVPNSQNKKGNSKNSNCPATITVRVKLNTKSVKKKDKFSKKGLFGVITISKSHNHSQRTSETLRFLPSSDCREAFFQYFEDGMNITGAIEFHVKVLKMRENFSSEMLDNSRLNPTLRSVQYFYTKWRLTNLGPIAHAASRMIKKLTDEKKSICVETRIAT